MTSFIASTIDRDSSFTGCQAAISTGSLFDQLARVSLEQALLWGLSSGSQKGSAPILPQLFLMIRFVLGGVFVGVLRPSFNPSCLPMSTVTPLGISVLCVDGLITSYVLFQGQKGRKRALKSVAEGAPKDSKHLGIMLCAIGFGIWTAVSVTHRTRPLS